MCVVFIQTEREIEGRRDREKYGGRGRRRREHATECPKPLEQGIFLVDWAIHSRHVTLNFFHYKTLLPSPLQRQIACTYFTQWNIASPLKQSFSPQSCEFFFLKQWLVYVHSAQDILWGFHVFFCGDCTGAHLTIQRLFFKSDSLTHLCA